MRPPPSAVIFRKRKITTVGEENICDNVQDALRRAEEVYQGLEQKFVGAKA